MSPTISTPHLEYSLHYSLKFKKEKKNTENSKIPLLLFPSRRLLPPVIHGLILNTASLHSPLLHRDIIKPKQYIIIFYSSTTLHHQTWLSKPYTSPTSLDSTWSTTMPLQLLLYPTPTSSPKVKKLFD